MIGAVDNSSAYSLLDLNRNGRRAVTALDIIGNVEVVDACACYGNLTELFTDSAFGYLIYAYGIDSIVSNCKTEGYIMSGGVILICKVEEESVVYVVKAGVLCLGNVGGSEVTEIKNSISVFTIFILETAEAYAKCNLRCRRGALCFCCKHLFSYSELVGEGLPLGGKVCSGGDQLPTVTPNVITVAVLVKCKLDPARLGSLSLEGNGYCLADVLGVSPDLIKHGQAGVLIIISAVCVIDSTEVYLQTVSSASELVKLSTGIDSISGSCKREASVYTVVASNVSLGKSYGYCILSDTVAGTEGVSNRFLEGLTVSCTDVIGNENGIIGSILDVVWNELPLLITVGAVPFTAKLLAGCYVIYLYLLYLVCGDRTGELELDGGVRANLIDIVNDNVGGNPDIVGSIDVNDDTLGAIILEPIVSIGVKCFENISAVVLVESVAEIMCDLGSYKAEERNVEVSRIVSGLGVIGVVRALCLTCLGTYTEDGSASLCKSVGRAATVSKYEVKAGVDDITGAVRENGLCLGSGNAGIGGVAARVKVRIYIRVATLEGFKTGLAHMTCVVTELLELLGSGVSKTNDYARLRVAVRTDLLGVDGSTNVSVALNVHTLYTDHTKGTEECCIGVDTVIIRKRISTVVTGYRVKLAVAAEVSVVVVTAHGNETVVGNYANVAVEERTVEVRTCLGGPGASTGVAGGHSHHNGKALAHVVRGVNDIEVEVKLDHCTVGLYTVGNVNNLGVADVGVLILLLLLRRKRLKLSLRNSVLTVSGLEPGSVVSVKAILRRLSGDSLGAVEPRHTVFVNPLYDSVTLTGLEVVVPDLNDVLEGTCYAMLIV